MDPAQKILLVQPDKEIEPGMISIILWRGSIKLIDWMGKTLVRE